MLACFVIMPFRCVTTFFCPLGAQKSWIPHNPLIVSPEVEVASTEDAMPVSTADEIEYIVERRERNRHVMYKVHWKGSSAAEDEWFDRDDLIVEYPDLVREYDARITSDKA
jgi:Chromo (CHRromatin Organisation MOdifier) domain